MNEYGELIDLIPVDKIAGRLGMSQESVASALNAAIPALVGGMKANASNPDGAASLEAAVAQHSSSLPDDGVDVDGIDAEDGAKIVQHVFGGNQQAVAAQLGSTGSGFDAGTVAKLLPLLAPLVMGFLSKRIGGSQGSGSAQSSTKTARTSAETSAQDGGLGDILGGLLGGGSGGTGGSIVDMLGGLLGGKR